jgi:hypothetical protein
VAENERARRSGWLWLWILIFAAAILLLILWAWPAREPAGLEPGERNATQVALWSGRPAEAGRPLAHTLAPSSTALSASRVDRL